MEKAGRKLSPDDSSTIAEAYIKYHDYLVAYAEQRGFSQDIAEDLVQETFLIILQNPDRFLSSSGKTAWMVSILRHCMGHYWRYAQYLFRIQSQLEQFRNDNETLMDNHSIRIIYDGIINREDLELLIQYYVDGYSYNDLCAHFGISETACRKRIQRAKARLRKALEE